MLGWRAFWLALVMVGIGLGAESAELRVIAVDSPEVRAIQALSGEWEALTGSRLDWSFLDQPAIIAQVRREARAAEDDPAAGRSDLVMLAMPEVAALGGEGLLSALPPAGAEALAVRGAEARFGAPYLAETALTYYRADLLAERGLTMPASPDLAAIRSLARSLDAPASGRAGLCLTARPEPEGNLALLALLAHVHGDAPISERAMADPASPWGRALADYRGLLSSFGTPETMSADTAGLARRFASGRCGIWIGPSTALGSITTLLGADPRTWLGVSLAPGSTTDGSVGWLRSAGSAVPVGASGGQAAIQFIGWATSPPVIVRAASAEPAAAAGLLAARATPAGAAPSRLRPFLPTLRAAIRAAVPTGIERAAGQSPDTVAHAVAAMLTGRLTAEATEAELVPSLPVGADQGIRIGGGLVERMFPGRNMNARIGRETGETTREVAARVRASRLFAGPEQYPPTAFAAYGIVAFPARASRADRERHEMLCEAYVANLPRTDELGLPVEQQMVTVWPVTEDKIADDLNGAPGRPPCETAVRNYGLPAALQAIRDVGPRLGPPGRGPFLLAWSPATGKGDPDAIVLIADLSDVTTAEQAATIFALWRQDIEANPALWDQGWDLEALRIGIRLWVDRVGTQIFAVLGA